MVKAEIRFVLVIIDRCGAESSKISDGPLYIESDATAKDLVALKTQVGKVQKWNHTGKPIPGNGRGRDLTRRYVEQLTFFEMLNLIFFCNGGGDMQVSNTHISKRIRLSTKDYVKDPARKKFPPVQENQSFISCQENLVSFKNN